MTELPVVTSRSKEARTDSPGAVLVWGLLLAGVGIFSFFHATFLSSGSLFVGDPTDSRFILYTLEHLHLWSTHHPAHRSLWDAPFYFPWPGSSTRSDLLFSIAPFYSAVRRLGAGPYEALQTWQVLAAALNFVAAASLLVRGARFRPIPALLGAYFVAFANMRAAQLGHLQLLPQFYSWFAFLSLWEGLRSDSWKRSVLFTMAAALLALEFWSSVYLGYLTLVIAAIVTAVAIARRPREAAEWLRGHLVPLALGGAVLAGLLFPLLQHYRDRINEPNIRTYAVDVEPFLLEPQAWLFMGRHSLFYHPWRDAPFFRMPMLHEKAAGMGLLTSAVALLGLARWRSNLRLPVLVGAAIFAVLIGRFGGFSLWHSFRELAPGAEALRAVGRGSIVVLPIVGIGVAQLASQLRAFTIALLAIGIVGEQAHSFPAFEKAAARERDQEVAGLVPPDCSVFYIAVRVDDPARAPSWLYQVDALQAQLATGIATANGYSGSVPPGYGALAYNVFQSSSSDLQAALRSNLPVLPPGVTACFVEAGEWTRKPRQRLWFEPRHRPAE